MASTSSYRYDFGNAQAIYLSNQGILTTVTFYSVAAGQQQSSQGVSTGLWKAPPKLYQLGGGYVAVIVAEQTFYLSIQGSRMQVSSGAGGKGIAQQISQLEPLSMQPTETPVTPSIQPMTPMTMAMGNMSMNMGEMQRGDMRLSSQASASSEAGGDRGSGEGAAAQKLCAQCGSAVGAGDRFCAQCGHKLS